MDPFLYIAASQAFFSGILIATKKPRIMANQVLAAWFLLICIEAIIVMINSNLVELYSIKVLPFTYGPLMYLYATFMTSEKPNFKPIFLLHFLPFILFLTLSFVFLNKPVMHGTKGFLLIDRFIPLRIIYGVSFFMSITYYSVITYITIHKHKLKVKTLLSYSSSKVTLQWLIGLSILFYLTYLLMFVFSLIDILLNIFPFDTYELSFFGLAIFGFLFGVYGVKQPAIFEELVYHNKSDSEKHKRDKQYARSGLKQKDIELYKEQLMDYMKHSQPYLKGDMSINDLADALSIPRHFLTEILNKHFELNFYTFINQFRVEEFKKRIINPEYKHLTLLAIAYDSGFNSKSTFNSIFKEMTGLTPSQYQKGFTQE